jgi:hypothetical protein
MAKVQLIARNAGLLSLMLAGRQSLEFAFVSIVNQSLKKDIRPSHSSIEEVAKIAS